MANIPFQPQPIIPPTTPIDPWFFSLAISQTTTLITTIVKGTLYAPQPETLFSSLEPGTKFRYCIDIFFLFLIGAIVLCGLVIVVSEVLMVFMLFRPTVGLAWLYVMNWRGRRRRRRERRRLIERMRFIEGILREGERRGFGRRGDGPGY